MKGVIFGMDKAKLEAEALMSVDVGSSQDMTPATQYVSRVGVACYRAYPDHRD